MSQHFLCLLLIKFVLFRNYGQATMGLYFSLLVMTTCILAGYYFFVGRTYYFHLQHIKRMHVLLPTAGYTATTLHRVIIRKSTAVVNSVET
jgi:hypothetical protein